MFKDFRLKLPAFACTRPLLFNSTGLSTLLNKIQFTFEVVPSLILGLFRRFFRRCASILAQCYEGVGGREEGVGGREEGVGGREEGVGGREEGVGGRGGEGGGRRKTSPGEDTR